MASTITIIDFETGGLDETTHQITEVGALNFDLKSFKVNWDYQTYIKPYCGLIYEKEVLEKTLVTENDILNGKDSKTVVKELIALFKQGNTSNGHQRGNTIICGHNVIGFDRRFLETLFILHDKDVYDYVKGEMHDTLGDAKRLWVGDEDKHNLKACCEKIGYKLTGAHGAMNDVRATYELYKYFTKRLRGALDVQPLKGENVKPVSQHRKFFQISR